MASIQAPCRRRTKATGGARPNHGTAARASIPVVTVAAWRKKLDHIVSAARWTALTMPW